MILKVLFKGRVLPKVLKNMFFGVTNEGLDPNRHLRLGTIFRNGLRTFLSWAWYACLDRRNEGWSRGNICIIPFCTPFRAHKTDIGCF